METCQRCARYLTKVRRWAKIGAKFARGCSGMEGGREGERYWSGGIAAKEKGNVFLLLITGSGVLQAQAA